MNVAAAPRILADRFDNNTLVDWFVEVSDTLRGQAPDPQNLQRLFDAVENNTGVRPSRILGAGDNGIALLASDRKSVLKFTIDVAEATLWNKLVGVNIPGLIHCYGAYTLVSSKTGPTKVCLVHVDYIPDDLDSRAAKLIEQANKQAHERKKIVYRRVMASRGTDPEAYVEIRTKCLINAFQEAAKQDRRLANIVPLISNLYLKYGIALFDLHSDNFRMTRNTVVLVDPSLPQFGRSMEEPAKLVFERKLRLSLEATMLKRIII